MKRVKVSFSYVEFDNLDDLSKKDMELINASRASARGAYAPYSCFRVGAAVLLENGVVVKGNNQENVAYPSGMCAERVAVFSASALYKDTIIEAIAISALSERKPGDHPVSPCGSCRQVLLEYERKQGKPIKVILDGKQGKGVIVDRVADLLPLAFSSE